VRPEIVYRYSRDFSPALALELLSRAGILHAGWNEERLNRAIKESSLVITAWENEKLVGFARTITDFAWCAYLSQLAVLPEYQALGIGKELIALTTKNLGPEVSLLVHSTEAPGFYTKLGFEVYENCYRLKRAF
jgi:ribosomal protein S18 acetylase RimI-like enzyme